MVVAGAADLAPTTVAYFDFCTKKELELLSYVGIIITSSFSLIRK